MAPKPRLPCSEKRTLYAEVVKNWRFAPISDEENQKQGWLMIAFTVDLQKWQKASAQKNAGRDVNSKEGSILNTKE